MSLLKIKRALALAVLLMAPPASAYGWKTFHQAGGTRGQMRLSFVDSSYSHLVTVDVKTELCGVDIATGKHAPFGSSGCMPLEFKGPDMITINCRKQTLLYRNQGYLLTSIGDHNFRSSRNDSIRNSPRLTHLMTAACDQWGGGLG